MIKYGLSKIHIGQFTETEDGVGVISAPVSIPGAVSVTIEGDEETADFQPDGLRIWSGSVLAGLSGDLEVVRAEAGTLMELKGTLHGSCFFAFETSGTDPERILLYNAVFDKPGEESSTITTMKDPETVSNGFTCVGDRETGVTMVAFSEGDIWHDVLFSDPPDPRELFPLFLLDENGKDILNQAGIPLEVKSEWSV